MAWYSFLPFLLSMGLVAFFALGWRREHKRLEQVKVRRARAHSAERAALAADYFHGFVSVKLIGALPDGDTLLVGYRRNVNEISGLFPGEKITDNQFVDGTLVAWPSQADGSSIEVVNRWCQDGTTVKIRVSEGGGNLIILEPETNITVSIGLIPTNI